MAEYTDPIVKIIGALAALLLSVAALKTSNAKLIEAKAKNKTSNQPRQWNWSFDLLLFWFDAIFSVVCSGLFLWLLFSASRTHPASQWDVVVIVMLGTGMMISTFRMKR